MFCTSVFLSRSFGEREGDVMRIYARELVVIRKRLRFAQALLSTDLRDEVVPTRKDHIARRLGRAVIAQVLRGRLFLRVESSAFHPRAVVNAAFDNERQCTELFCGGKAILVAVDIDMDG